jgi:glycosyltransferase involved in cell wall biosynthesis
VGKVLFISHDASRTGAPILLLTFLKWFKANTNIPFSILLRNGGELESEFADLAPTKVLNIKTSENRTFLERVLFNLSLGSGASLLHRNHVKKSLLSNDIHLVYSNTITNGSALEMLKELNCSVITHVHELESWIQRSGFDNFERVRQYTTHFIAASGAVKDNLTDNHQIPEHKIDVVHAFTTTSHRELNKQQETRHKICAQLGIPEQAKIICASGTTEWRKGTDLFSQLARSVHRCNLNTPIYFLWVGGEQSGEYFDELQYDTKKLGLDKYVLFLGRKTNPQDYFAACDIFALMSREDPYPLVCLEAASLGKPIICFDGAGGEKEFVEDDCGFVVPYLDVEEMAAKIVDLLTSPDRYQCFSKRAQQKVYDLHRVEVAGAQILQIIKKFLQ